MNKRVIYDFDSFLSKKDKSLSWLNINNLLLYSVQMSNVFEQWMQNKFEQISPFVHPFPDAAFGALSRRERTICLIYLDPSTRTLYIAGVWFSHWASRRNFEQMNRKNVSLPTALRWKLLQKFLLFQFIIESVERPSFSLKGRVSVDLAGTAASKR